MEVQGGPVEAADVVGDAVGPAAQGIAQVRCLLAGRGAGDLGSGALQADGIAGALEGVDGRQQGGAVRAQLCALGCC